MVYKEPNWDVPYFLQMTAICPSNPPGRQCYEYRVWADSIEELEEYAQNTTPSLVYDHYPEIMEYLIWEGVPSPQKCSVKKWVYKPTIDHVGLYDTVEDFDDAVREVLNKLQSVANDFEDIMNMTDGFKCPEGLILDEVAHLTMKAANIIQF